MNEPSDHPQVLCEHSDVRCGPIVAVIATVAISLALAGLAAAWFLRRENRVHAPWAAPGGRTPAVAIPAEPRLEPLAVPTPDGGPSFLARQQAQEAALHTFGKTDDAGFVRVPIETAIGQLAKALQAAGPPAERSAKSHGLVAGGEANSGRSLRKAAP